MTEYNLERGIIDDYLMESSFDEASSQMFNLLSCLDEKVTSGRWESNRDALSSIACPDVEPRIPRATMDC